MEPVPTRVFDCFTFAAELDLLKLRLQTLDPVVDVFVLVEAELTHSGFPKPLTYREHADDPDLAPYRAKIRHIVAPLEPEAAPWDRENAQRKAIWWALHDLRATDTVMISDLDEIPAPWLVTAYAASTKHPVVAHQRLFYYDFDREVKTGWNGTVLVRGAELAGARTLQDLRDRRNELPRVERDEEGRCAGWHCSSFGDAAFVRQKIRSFAHTEYATDEHLAAIEDRMAHGVDMFARSSVQLTPNDVDADDDLPTMGALWRTEARG